MTVPSTVDRPVVHRSWRTAMREVAAESTGVVRGAPGGWGRVHGRCAPGEHLEDLEPTAWRGLSRTPVREAQAAPRADDELHGALVTVADDRAPAAVPEQFTSPAGRGAHRPGPHPAASTTGSDVVVEAGTVPTTRGRTPARGAAQQLPSGRLSRAQVVSSRRAGASACPEPVSS